MDFTTESKEPKVEIEWMTTLEEAVYWHNVDEKLLYT